MATVFTIVAIAALVIGVPFGVTYLAFGIGTRLIERFDP